MRDGLLIENTVAKYTELSDKFDRSEPFSRTLRFSTKTKRFIAGPWRRGYAKRSLVVPGFATVFGARIGIDGPDVLMRRFGKGSGVTRHNYRQDDGWNWWEWPQGNGYMQVYWSPAYPKSKRQIESFSLVEKFGPSPAKDFSVYPTTRVAAWLAGIQIGMSKERCLTKLTNRFGPPGRNYQEYVWESQGWQLSVLFEDDSLAELGVRFVPSSAGVGTE